MPALRDGGPYIHPSWLTRLLVGMDRCEWMIWFHAQHDRKIWTRIDSDFKQVNYNIPHTELVRRSTDGLEALSFDVAVEYQNEFRFKLQGSTISGRPDPAGLRGRESLIVDATASQPSHVHQTQVMLYRASLDGRNRRKQRGKPEQGVRYGPRAERWRTKLP